MTGWIPLETPDRVPSLRLSAWAALREPKRQLTHEKALTRFPRVASGFLSEEPTFDRRQVACLNQLQ